MMRERRREPRVLAADVGLSARLRPGGEVCLVDVCAGGALVQTGRQLRPGARVHVLVTSLASRLAVPAVVVRCAVAALHPTDGVLYWGALKFEEALDLDPVRGLPAVAGVNGAVV